MDDEAVVCFYCAPVRRGNLESWVYTCEYQSICYRGFRFVVDMWVRMGTTRRRRRQEQLNNYAIGWLEIVFVEQTHRHTVVGLHMVMVATPTKANDVGKPFNTVYSDSVRANMEVYLYYTFWVRNVPINKHAHIISSSICYDMLSICIGGTQCVRPGQPCSCQHHSRTTTVAATMQTFWTNKHIATHTHRHIHTYSVLYAPHHYSIRCGLTSIVCECGSVYLCEFTCNRDVCCCMCVCADCQRCCFEYILHSN